MHSSLFSPASALTLSSIVSVVSAGIAGLSPRGAGDRVDKRLVCVGDTLNQIFMSVGMGDPNSGPQQDIDNFCRSFIHIPDVTSFVQTLTPTTTFFPATVTVDSTTEVVSSPTSTVTVTASETEYALKRRSHMRMDEMHKREAAPVVTPKAEIPERMVIKARQAASNSSRTLDVAALETTLSSACSCRFLDPLTAFDTSTAPLVTRTIGATDFRTVTLNSTVPGGVTTVTETLNVTSTIRPTGTGSSSSSTLPTLSSNSTVSGTGISSSTGTTFSHSSFNSTYSPGTGSSSFPLPTGSSACKNATVTAVSTTTEVTVETVSIVTFLNTVTETEASVTITETVTVPGAGSAITDGDTDMDDTATASDTSEIDVPVTTTTTEDTAPVTDVPEIDVPVTTTATEATGPVIDAPEIDVPVFTTASTI